jgi:hypothetical protein
MRKLVRLGATALVVAFVSGAPAAGQQTSVVRYTCNIEGAQAELTAQVQAVSPAGVFMDPGGRFGGAIGTGEVNYHYQGSLVSVTGARYAFTGENQFADFVDLNRNERFRVQMIVQGQTLLMIVNPHGPGPVRYLCQTAGR